MTTIFNIGDRVKCIKGTTVIGLVEGKEYTIIGTNEDRVRVAGISYPASSKRFVKIIDTPFKVGDKVTCINASDTQDLYKNYQYTIEHIVDCNPGIVVLSDVFGFWYAYADRFVLSKITAQTDIEKRIAELEFSNRVLKKENEILLKLINKF